MADRISQERRSWNMSRIHSKDTAIEIAVRQWLFRNGYRYRKHVKDLPGKPDIVLQTYKSVIFIHGCFWHRHPGCKNSLMPKTRTEYWQAKFDRNVANDMRHQHDLEKLGFQVIVLWECEITKHFEETMNRVSKLLGPAHHR